MVRQGDILFIDLNPTKGNEMAKKRLCVVVSNDYYNKSFNTVLVMPLSSSKKYVEEKFARSNAFQTVTETQKSKVQGTILCQHIRGVDLLHRSNLEVVDKVTTEMKERLSEITKHFF